MCGGTTLPGMRPTHARGLSPRVRGNRAKSACAPAAKGTIPACAGEPKVAPVQGGVALDYPRVCGGTRPIRNPASPVWGLSPRVRGNPLCPSRHIPGAQTIPACAGEPYRQTARTAVEMDYPRVCGGTCRGAARPCKCGGLSPRVRGNRVSVERTHKVTRTVPACAGEPRANGNHIARRRDCPRVCGGTSFPRGRPGLPTGLSPRVRGNRTKGKCWR